MLVLFSLDAVTAFYSIWEHLGLHNKNDYTTSVMIFFLMVKGKSNHFSEV